MPPEVAATTDAAPSTQAAAPEFPNSKEIKRELKRLNEQSRFRQTLKNTLFTLITIAALATLIAIFVFPVFQVHGSSMNPTLSEGDILVSVRTGEPARGDIVACYYGNKLILRRLVAVGGDVVQIAEDGRLIVNDEEIAEPYVKSLALGTCDIEFPFTVPVGECFLLGDNRESALDSRSTILGTIPNDQIAGRVILRVWPFESFGPVE